MRWFKRKPEHIHKWKVVSVAPFDDYEIWWGEKYLTNQHTAVIMRCTTCGAIRQHDLDGHHELKKLQSTESDSTDDGKF